jgi:hypothetical protein
MDCVVVFPLVFFFFPLLLLSPSTFFDIFDGALLRCSTHDVHRIYSLLLFVVSRTCGWSSLSLVLFFFFFFPFDTFDGALLRCSSPTPDVLVRHPTDRTLFSRSSLLT